MLKPLRALIGVTFLFLFTACGEDAPKVFLWKQVHYGMSYEDVLKAYGNDVINKFEDAVVVKNSREFGMNMSPLIKFENGKVTRVVLRLPDDIPNPTMLKIDTEIALTQMRGTYSNGPKEERKRPAYGPSRQKLTWQEQGKLLIEAEVFDTWPLNFTIIFSRINDE